MAFKLQIAALIFILSAIGMAQTPQPSPSPTPSPSPSPSPKSEAGKEAPKSPTKDAKKEPPKETPPPFPAKTVWVAHVLRQKKANTQIEGLALIESQVPIVMVAKDESLKPMVQIKGIFQRPDWTLYVQDVPITLSKTEGNLFTVPIYLKGRVSEVPFTVVGPKKEKKVERIYIYAPEAQELQLISPWNAVIVSFGVSNLGYFQTEFGTYRSNNGQLGVEYERDFLEKWGLYLSGNMTVLNFDAMSGNLGAQLLEAKIDGKYQLNERNKTRWNYDLLGGVSYLTMFSNGGLFGFSNLLAPEIGARAKYILSPQDALIGEGRYIFAGPVGDLAQYGLNLTFKYSRLLENAHRCDVGLGFSSYTFYPTTSTMIQTNLLYLTLGYSI